MSRRMITASTRERCAGRTPGNILTSYACTRYARPGSSYCYWHDPATEQERAERHRKAALDRRLEHEERQVRRRNSGELR